MRAFAARQECCVAAFQLDALGLTSDHWWLAKRNGRWDELTDEVLRLHGAPASDRARAIAAVLDVGPGAALCADSTLGLYAFRGYTLRDLHVAYHRMNRTRRRRLAKLHVLRDLRARDVTIYNGVPTLTPLRAIWMIAARYAAPHRREKGVRIVKALVVEANKRGLLTLQSLHDSVDELRDRGRGGTVIMRMVAASMPVGSSLVETNSEMRLTEILEEANRSPFEPQVETGEEELIGRVDFRDRELPLVVEVNSILHHTLPPDRAADELRYKRLNDAGFMVCVIWDVDLWPRRQAVIRAVDEARRRARRGERSVLHSVGCPWPGAEIVK